jgi:outer membrane protein assembly factor BamB
MSPPRPKSLLYPAILVAVNAAVATALTIPGCDSLSGEDSDEVRVAWSVPTGDEFLARTMPLLADGRAYVAYDEVFAAFDADDGERIWTAPFHMHAGSSALTVLEEGGDDGTLFLHYVDWVRAIRKQNGGVSWTTSFEEAGVDRVRMAQTESHIFLGRRNEIARLRKSDGSIDLRLNISHLTPEGVEHLVYDVILSTDGATLYVATGYYVPEAPATSGYVLGYDAGTGERLWTFPVPQRTRTLPDGFERVLDAAVYGLDVSDDLVVFPAGHSVWALDRHTGEAIWERFIEDDGFHAGATLSGGHAFIGSALGQIYKFDLTTGQIEWATRTRGSIFAPLIVQSGKVYTKTMTGEIWILDAGNGAVVWNGSVPGRNDAFLSPVGVGENRMVAVGEQNVYGLTKP